MINKILEVEKIEKIPRFGGHLGMGKTANSPGFTQVSGRTCISAKQWLPMGREKSNSHCCGSPNSCVSVRI